MGEAASASTTAATATAAAAPRDRSVAASAVRGNPDSHEVARAQYQAGKLLYSEAAHNPMLSNRPSTPVHSSSEASIEMSSTSQHEMHLRPISTDFDSATSDAAAVAVVKAEPDAAPSSTGLIDQPPLSASDPSYVANYYNLSGSGGSAGSLATPHSDSISPTQMSPKHGSDGAVTLPQTPASATFPFGYSYQVPVPTSTAPGGYALSVHSMSQMGSTGYNLGLESVESNNTAFGYNLVAYPQTINYGKTFTLSCGASADYVTGVSKEYMGQNSLGLAADIGATMAQQAMNTFNQQFLSPSTWSAQSSTTFVAPGTIQPSTERNVVESASPLQAFSPTPSDSDDESDDNNAPCGLQPLSAPANAMGGFAAQQELSGFDGSGSARSNRRSTIHGSQVRPQASQLASPAPRRSTRRRSSVGLSLRSAGGVTASLSDGSFSARRKHLTLDEDERERYEREAAERDESRVKEMEEFEHGPLRGNRKERRRMQNRLAQRSFRARSKIQNQEVTLTGILAVALANARV